ncbi:HNH endonuclease [Bacillus sp. FJAT-45037]|uniref:HNH endonuclease n=1 Tax=Bacillus sp. FJAT-45037 TaxID=2011007 RepID=UPI000C243E56|nr:HNH endonuclease [Bacillus sp. FJAT-45037]
MALKEQHMALSSGIGLAGLAVTNFWEFRHEAFDIFKDEIIDSIVKPSRLTAVHHYLYFFQDIYEEIDGLKKNSDDMEYVYNFIVRTLDEVNLKPNLPIPSIESCNDQYGHFKCSCTEVIEEWINYANEYNNELDELIVHSAFQFIFQDRKFIHDFHLELSTFIEKEMETIKETYPEYVTSKNRLKRQYFPEWLKSAVLHRDKGTCVICRCDLSNLIRSQNSIHIDHIIPLQLFGSNDASNMQLLCEKCNTTKGARSTDTSSVNVPFWNL